MPPALEAGSGVLFLGVNMPDLGVVLPDGVVIGVPAAGDLSDFSLLLKDNNLAVVSASRLEAFLTLSGDSAEDGDPLRFLGGGGAGTLKQSSLNELVEDDKIDWFEKPPPSLLSGSGLNIDPENT